MFDNGFLKDFFNQQMAQWPLAEENYNNLGLIKKKQFQIGDLKGWVQFNPARAGSSLAKVDSAAIQKRACFLCLNNRPESQLTLNISDEFELLVNPFPILPLHFTIPSKKHIPQKLSIADGIELAKMLPDMIVFFNSEGAGASAPDHYHFQAVPKGSLPLISLLNNKRNGTHNLPFAIIQNVKDDENYKNKPANAFFWTSDSGKVETLIIPRTKHRPEEFYREPPYRRAVSPGAIDMAGVIVTPFEEDFELLSKGDIQSIYQQVALPIQ